MFNPTSLDDVSVQATHLEARGKNVNLEIGGSSKPPASKNKEKKKFGGKKKKIVVAIQKDLGSDSGDETTVTTTSIKGYPL